MIRRRISRLPRSVMGHMLDDAPAPGPRRTPANQPPARSASSPSRACSELDRRAADILDLHTRNGVARRRANGTDAEMTLTHPALAAIACRRRRFRRSARRAHSCRTHDDKHSMPRSSPSFPLRFPRLCSARAKPLSRRNDSPTTRSSLAQVRPPPTAASRIGLSPLADALLAPVCMP